MIRRWTLPALALTAGLPLTVHSHPGLVYGIVMEVHVGTYGAP